MDEGCILFAYDNNEAPILNSADESCRPSKVEEAPFADVCSSNHLLIFIITQSLAGLKKMSLLSLLDFILREVATRASGVVIPYRDGAPVSFSAPGKNSPDFSSTYFIGMNF